MEDERDEMQESTEATPGSLPVLPPLRTFKVLRPEPYPNATVLAHRLMVDTGTLNFEEFFLDGRVVARKAVRGFRIWADYEDVTPVTEEVRPIAGGNGTVN